MSIFKDFFVKEKPVFTGIARGVGGFSFGGGGGASADGTEFRAGNGGLAGGGGGGRGTDHPQPTIAGLGGAGCVILYW